MLPAWSPGAIAATSVGSFSMYRRRRRMATIIGMRSTAAHVWGRLVAGMLLALAAIGAVASPAAAVLTSNDVGCEASADITAADGRTVSIDAEDAEATVPTDGTAAWQGSLATATHDHAGEVRLEVGPWWDVELGRWGPSANAAGETSADGTLELASYLGEVPAGRYKMTGFHQGVEGGCAGEMTVEIEGTPFSNIAGISGLVGTGFFGALLLVSALARKRA